MIDAVNVQVNNSLNWFSEKVEGVIEKPCYMNSL